MATDDKPRKLKRWELARVAKTFHDEIRDRTEGPFSRERPCGDPADITAMEAALAILYANSESSYGD